MYRTVTANVGYLHMFVPLDEGTVVKHDAYITDNVLF
jgi:hypothetical protein